MATVRFDIDIDDEALAAFDSLRVMKGQDRPGMIAQIVAEFVQRESETEGYDAWFRQEVGEALTEMERPDAVFYSHEDVMTEMSNIVERRIMQARKRAG